METIVLLIVVPLWLILCCGGCAWVLDRVTEPDRSVVIGAMLWMASLIFTIISTVYLGYLVVNNL